MKVYINAAVHLLDKRKFDPDGVGGHFCNLAPLSHENRTELLNFITFYNLSD